MKCLRGFHYYTRGLSRQLSTAAAASHSANNPTSSATNPHSANNLKPPKQELINTALRDLVARNFPDSQLCFAYGSKILHQTNNLPTDNTMTDLIFVPKNSKEWHKENFVQVRSRKRPDLVNNQLELVI